MYDDRVISIIVPVYNTEKHIVECVESILGQSYSKLEIILVDDGSSDGSGKLCDEFAKQDSRIMVIHQKNAGVSAARNTGLKYATGYYLQFVDSDDTLAPTMCEELVDAMESTGVQWVICGYQSHYDSMGWSRIVSCPDSVFENKADLLGKFERMFEKNLFNIPWNKLFIRTEISSQFDESLSLGEDLLFNLDYLEDHYKINFLNRPLYHYRLDDEQTLSHRFNPKRFEVECMLLQKVFTFCDVYFGTHEYDSKVVYTGFSHSICGDLDSCVASSDLSFQEKYQIIKRLLSQSETTETFRVCEARGLYLQILKKFIQKRFVFGVYWVVMSKRMVRILLQIRQKLKY